MIAMASLPAALPAAPPDGVASAAIAAQGSQGERLEASLERARAEETFLVVAFLAPRDLAEGFGPGGTERRLLASALEPHATLFLAADERPLLRARLGVVQLPQFLLVDGDLREVGRVVGPFSAAEIGGRLATVARCAEDRLRALGSGRSAPADLAEAYWLGSHLLHCGERLRALSVFDHIISAAEAGEPLSPDLLASVLLRVAHHQVERGDSSEAQAGFRKALSVTSTPVIRERAAVSLARSLASSGKTDEALEVLEKLVSESSGEVSTEALFTLAYLHQERGEADAARPLFEACSRRTDGSGYPERARRYLAPTLLERAQGQPGSPQRPLDRPTTVARA